MASNGIRVRGITIEIKADLSGLVKSFKSADSALKKTQNNLKSISSFIKGDNSWGGLKNKVKAITLQKDLLGSAIDNLKVKIEAEKKAQQEAAGAGLKTTTEQVAKLQSLQTQIILDEAELEKLEKEFKEFGSVGKQKAIAVGNAMEATGTKISAVGDKISAVGRSMMLYLTTPLVGAGTKAVQFAGDFDEAMSKVQAVSLGATVEEMDQLRQMAIDLSKDSKYNATEAAEALYYMGLAGWDASEMMKALPDVLDLAAAGDMDLGRASDIVTDYITAFGLTADDTTDFVNILAKTMVNSNTDVDQLGDAFKYVAPVAGALGYSVEDVAFALGLMANNGIKASQAGTSLRMFMQRLAKPTAEVQTAMDNLGLTIENEDGTMKSFKQIMDDLRDALGSPKMAAEELASRIDSITTAFENGELTEEEYEQAMADLTVEAYGVEGAEKAKNAAILAGTRGMSGLLAIVNTTAEDYDALSTAINGTDQSAKDIAATMLDNTNGALIQLKNSAYALGISFGDELTPYIKDAAKWLKSLADKYADLDPKQKKMVLKLTAIAAAAGPVVLVAGKLVKGFGNMLTGAGKLVKGIAKLSTHTDKLKTVFSGIKTGVTSFIKLIAAHPIAAAATALAAVIAILVAKLVKEKKAAREAELQTWGLSDANKALIDKISASKNAYDEAKKSRDETGKGILLETSRLQKLEEELSDIVDENGKVKKGYEDRAKVIAEQLNEALGTEITITDGIIEDYQTLQTEIKNLITLHKAEAALEAYKDDYISAIEDSSEAYKNYTDASAALAEQQGKVAKLEKAIRDHMLMYPEASADKLQAMMAEDKEYTDLVEELEVAKAAEDDLKKAVEDAHGVYTDGQQIISNYDKAYEAFVSGNISAAESAVNNMLTGFQTFDTASEEQLKAQVEKYEALYEQAKTDVENGVAGVSKATVDGYKDMVAKAKAELKLYNQAVKDSGDRAVTAAGNRAKKIGPAVGSGIKAGMGDYKTIGKAQGITFIDGIAGTVPKAKKAGKDLAKSAGEGASSVSMKGPGSDNVNSYIDGLNSEKSSERLQKAGKKMAHQGRDGAESVSYKSTGEKKDDELASGMKTKTQKVKDQAKATAQAAKDEVDKFSWKSSAEAWVAGGIAGIKAKVALLTKEAEKAAEDTQKAFDKPLLIKSPSRRMMESGENFDKGAAIGIKTNAHLAIDAAANLAEETAAAFSYNTTSPSYGMNASAGSKTWNMGGTVLNIYQQPGQDANELANYVMDKFYREVNQRLAVVGG